MSLLRSCFKVSNSMRIIILIMCLIFIPKLAWCQIEEEVFQKNVLTRQDYQEDWVPTLLKSTSMPLPSLAKLNGYVFHWNVRGKMDDATKIDGLNWKSSLSGWSASLAYASLYKAFQIVNVEIGNPNGLVNSWEGQLNSSVGNAPSSLNAGMRFSNSSFVQEYWLHYKSGWLVKKRRTNFWAFQLFASWQEAPLGLLPIGFKKSSGVLLNAQKFFKKEQTISWSIWWNPSSQGKISPSVQEAFNLSHQRNYNPNQGWYKGRLWYAGTKSSAIPMSTIQYEKKWAPNGFLQANIGGAYGIQSQTQLDWTNTMDPRPDYYKYLPSYSKDSLMRNQLTQFFLTHPQALQINYDALEKINQSNILKRSFYIINRKMSEISIVKVSLLGSYFMTPYIQAQVGMQLSMNKVRSYNIMENLIGGDFFYNYNGWVDDNGSENNFQNDIQHPNRKIKKGDQWGSDAVLTHQQVNYWAIVKKEFLKHEISLRYEAAQNIFQRIGLLQNGLFPNRSLGKSFPLFFPEFQIQGQYVYKFSGKWYANLILQKQTNAPISNEIYLDPSLHDATASFLLPEVVQGAVFSIYYRSVSSKWDLSIYTRSVKNETEKKLFYHDQYGAFVYGMVGQKNSNFKGIEWSGEKNISSSIQFIWASTWNDYVITNNPLYEFKMTNDLFKVESGSLLLKNMPATSSPQMVHAISLVYQPNFSFRFGITGVFALKRSANFNPFRRSQELLHIIQEPNSLNNLMAPYWLPNQMVWNSFISKNAQMHWGVKKTTVKCSLSIKNIFNTLIPILVFEQSRYDYIGNKLEKFPMKYLYDQGATCTAGIQITIQ